MRHSSWDSESDSEAPSLNDCRVKNMKEFEEDGGNGTYGQRPREKVDKKKERKATKELIKLLKKIKIEKD